MTEANFEDELTNFTVAVRSRSIKGIHYEQKQQKMCVLTSSGRFKIYKNVHPSVVREIIQHQYPGYAFDTARRDIGPELSQLTPSGFLSAISARRAFRNIGV
ncbi:hypothetical protein [Rhizobium sp. Leaf383]|uniref:hypothetical protein n=1 Tax=Rhizobium sp. Leaf383 TaxID=1736357 RepID=UPI0012E3C020|nr:hypothetical protein [Rhizobium sp. Leaf383]